MSYYVFTSKSFADKHFSQFFVHFPLACRRTLPQSTLFSNLLAHSTLSASGISEEEQKQRAARLKRGYHGHDIFWNGSTIELTYKEALPQDHKALCEEALITDLARAGFQPSTRCLRQGVDAMYTFTSEA
jgi:hypothetical protein